MAKLKLGLLIFDAGKGVKIIIKYLIDIVLLCLGNKISLKFLLMIDLRQ
jgi:hypothetical protein